MKSWLRKHKQTMIATIIILIIVGMCIANIYYSFKYKDECTNIFATISGWLGVISTIILGLIAVWQSKKYTLLSVKSELKEEIYNEKRDIVIVLDNIAQYSKLTKMLNILVMPGPQYKLVLDTKVEVDGLTEQLISTSIRIQLFRHIPETMVKIVRKISEMILFTSNEYKEAIDISSNDDAFSQKIKLITNNAIDWIRNIAELRNKAIEELRQEKLKIDTCKSIAEIENLEEGFNNKLNKAQLEAQKEIDDIIKQCDKSKEDSNGVA